jgi:hypothetical protein
MRSAEMAANWIGRALLCVLCETERDTFAVLTTPMRHDGGPICRDCADRLVKDCAKPGMYSKREAEKADDWIPGQIPSQDSLRRVIERAMIRDDEANRRYIDPERLRQVDADSVSAWLEAKDARIRELEAEVAMLKLNAQYNNHSRDIANAKALNEIKCIVRNLECL